MTRSMPGIPVHHRLLESTQTYVHCVGDAIQPSHPLFAAKDGEALYSQQKQDWEVTVAQIMNSLLPNSDLN